MSVRSSVQRGDDPEAAHARSDTAKAVVPEGRDAQAVVPEGRDAQAATPSDSIRTGIITDEEEAAVLECLRRSGTALTARQVQAAVAGDAASVERALSGLMYRGLASRLNTIIPSYVYRMQQGQDGERREDPG